LTMPRCRAVTMLFAAPVLCLVGMTGVASAGTPTYVSLTVPGDGGPTSASWQGAALSGLPILPSLLCLHGQCDEEEFLLFARDPDYASAHPLTLTVSLTYDTSAGR